MLGGSHARLATSLALALGLAACAELTGEGPSRGDIGSLTATAGGSTGRHVVAAGETLSEIAERYGLGLSVLASANSIEPPYRVQAGSSLLIPSPSKVSRGQTKTVTVRPGDTMAAIAARRGLRLGAIVAANPGIDPDRIQPGQTIAIPGDVVMPPAPALSPAELASVKQAAAEKPPSLSGEGFLWPVQGTVVSRFGDKPNGTRNAGVNIAAAAGTPVRAVENGIVVYAGDDLPGYGRLLLLRHAGNFTTAYAHNRQLLAKLGEKVERGQKIALVGATGGVGKPQLHFEVRLGSQAIDPQTYLDKDSDRTQVAAKNAGAMPDG
jgi:murein DD-endopeptidase MepM/ murein hydrolase activator NlpD